MKNNKLVKFLSLTLAAFAVDASDTTSLSIEVYFNDQQKHEIKNSSIAPVLTEQVNEKFKKEYMEISQNKELEFADDFKNKFISLFSVKQGGNNISVKFDYHSFKELIGIKKEDGSLDRLKSLFYKKRECLTLPYELCLTINIDGKETKEIYFDRINGDMIYFSNDKYEKGYKVSYPTQCSAMPQVTITPQTSRKSSNAEQEQK